MVSLVTEVYRFIEESQKWEEFLKPIPTARCCLSVASTQSVIVPSGDPGVSVWEKIIDSWGDRVFTIEPPHG